MPIDPRSWQTDCDRGSADHRNCRAISLDAKVLIMDEPTAALSGHGSTVSSPSLPFTAIKTSLMFISHRMGRNLRPVRRRDDHATAPPCRPVTWREPRRGSARARWSTAMLISSSPSWMRRSGDRSEGRRTTRFWSLQTRELRVRSGKSLDWWASSGAGRSRVVQAIRPGIDKADGGTVTAFRQVAEAR